jgi:hypothetical protein
MYYTSTTSHVFSFSCSHGKPARNRYPNTCHTKGVTMTGKLWFFAAVPVFVMLTAGCGSNVNKVKAVSWENSSVTNEKAFAKAFEGGVWSDAKNEKGEKVVQFTGKISQGIHDFAVEKLHKSDMKFVFVAACNYLAAQYPDGKIPQTPDITFDTAKLPIKNGTLVSPLVDGYLSNKNNTDSIAQFLGYYDKRYWEAGTDVIIQWGVYAGGKIIKVQKITNKFWDADPTFQGKTELIMKIIFGFSR